MVYFPHSYYPSPNNHHKSIVYHAAGVLSPLFAFRDDGHSCALCRHSRFLVSDGVVVLEDLIAGGSRHLPRAKVKSEYFGDLR